MECCCCCSSHQAKTEVNQIFLDFKENFSTAIKVILPKIVFDLTVGRLSKNGKNCLLVLLFARKVHKDVVFKSAINTTSASLTIKVI